MVGAVGGGFLAGLAAYGGYRILKKRKKEAARRAFEPVYGGLYADVEADQGDARKVWKL